MTFLADGRTAFGESAAHALATLALAGADAVGMNCTLGPQETHDIFSQAARPRSRVPLSVMPNAGYPSVVHGRNVYLSSPDYLREYAAAFVEAGAAIVGGCCGTTPEHIRAMAREVAGARRAGAGAPGLGRRRDRRRARRRGRRRDLAAQAQARRRRRVRRSRPRSSRPRARTASAAIEGARLLKAGGVDAVNVTDNPMARLRMSSIAVAALIQRETGLDAVVQITTRDRNVLGLQSDLLGAAGLGVKAILCLGGDPLKIGDYPQAKQVSEVDVLGLLRIAKGLNAGADLAGNAIGAPTRFAIACAANPAAADQEVEFSKLRAKIEAGATFAQTQPVYDLEALERFLARPEARAIPILVGLIPLLSLKQTLFFANEVPGIVVPAAIQERMRRAAEQGHGARAGRGPRDRARARGGHRRASPGGSTSCRWAGTRPWPRSSRRSPAPRRPPRAPRLGRPRNPAVACPVFPAGPDSHRIRTNGRKTGTKSRPGGEDDEESRCGWPRRSVRSCRPDFSTRARSAALLGTVTDSAGAPIEGAAIVITTPEPRRPSSSP